MDSILFILIIFVAGLYIGYKVQEKIMFYTMAEMFKQAGITNKELDKFIGHFKEDFEVDTKDEEGYEVVDIKVEKHGEVLYAFRKDNDQFLGQGSCKESLIARLGEKAVGIRMVVAEGDGAEFIGGQFDVDKDGNIKEKS
jgi:hypothetical protein